MNEKLKEVFKIFDIEYSQKIEKDFEKLYELLIE